MGGDNHTAANFIEFEGNAPRLACRD